VYNMALSMASTGHLNLSPNWGMFTLGGKTYHRLSANFVNPRGPPAFAQIYMLDTSAATQRRLEIFPASQHSSGASLDAAVLSQLHDLLLEINPWVRQFRSAGMNNVRDTVSSASTVILHILRQHQHLLGLQLQQYTCTELRAAGNDNISATVGGGIDAPANVSSE
jgi:hypothetical protein